MSYSNTSSSHILSYTLPPYLSCFLTLITLLLFLITPPHPPLYRRRSCITVPDTSYLIPHHLSCHIPYHLTYHASSPSTSSSSPSFSSSSPHPPHPLQTTVVYYGAGHVRASRENRASPLTPLWGYSDDGTGLEDQVLECSVTAVRFIKCGPTIPRHPSRHPTDPSSSSSSSTTSASSWTTEKDLAAAEAMLINESTPFGSAFALIDLSIVPPTIPITHPAPGSLTRRLHTPHAFSPP